MTKDIKNILILRFGAFGDIIHTTIIAQTIKKKYPNCKITYCTEEVYKEVVRHCKYVDSVISYDGKRRKDFSYNFQFALELRKQKFDIIFNLTNALRNKLISFVAAPKKIVTHKKDKNLHVVENFYKTAKNVIKDIELPKNLEIDVEDSLYKKMEEKLSPYKKPYMVFAPAGNNNTSRQGRIWNENYWVELGNKLNEKYSGTVIITGHASELDYHKKIASKINGSLLLTGELTLTQSMCVYKLADIVIAGDTGSLHAASALSTTTIGIFGSTDIKNVKPYGEKGYCVYPKENVCRFCWKKKCKYLKNGEIYTPCMESIKPADVLELIENNNLLK